MARSTIPGPTRSKAPRRILIALIVLIVLLVAADRIGDAVAENVAADKLQQPLGVQNLDVDIDGFPFLTQLASGNYDEIEFTTKDYEIGGSGLRLDTVRATFDDVTARDKFSRFHAARASGVAVSSYASLSRALGVTISYAGDGRIKASKRISLLGYTIDPTITVRPEVSGAALNFLGARVNGLGSFAGDVSTVVDQVFGTGLPLEGLPFKARVTGLKTTEQGLQLDLAASDLTYVR